LSPCFFSLSFPRPFFGGPPLAMRRASGLVARLFGPPARFSGSYAFFFHCWPEPKTNLSRYPFSSLRELLSLQGFFGICRFPPMSLFLQFPLPSALSRSDILPCSPVLRFFFAAPPASHLPRLAPPFEPRRPHD